MSRTVVRGGLAVTASGDVHAYALIQRVPESRCEGQQKP